MTRLAVVHIGWPKTATTSLQHQLRVGWPNLAGRPWNRPGGYACQALMQELVRGRTDGPAIDALLASSWHDQTLPVVVSHEGLVGMRKWQHDLVNNDALAVPGYLAATSWPVHVVATLRDPVELVRSNYRYAVRGGYARSYAEFLEEERANLLLGRGPFAIRNVIEAWERSFGRSAITVAWMDAMVHDPVAFWGDIATATGVSEFARIGDIPLENRNQTSLGPLRWELALNRVLAPKEGRRRSPYTNRLRRAYNRYVAGHLSRLGSTDPAGGMLEQSVVGPMRDDLAWLTQRYNPRTQR